MLLLDFGYIPIFLASASLISLGFMILIRIYPRRFKLIGYTGRQSLTIMIAHIYIPQDVTYVGYKIMPTMSAWVYLLFTTVLSVLARLIVEKKLPCLTDFKYFKQLKSKNKYKGDPV